MKTKNIDFEVLEVMRLQAESLERKDKQIERLKKIYESLTGLAVPVQYEKVSDKIIKMIPKYLYKNQT